MKQEDGTSPSHDSDEESNISPKEYKLVEERVKTVHLGWFFIQDYDKRYITPDYSNVFFDYKKNGYETHKLWFLHILRIE